MSGGRHKAATAVTVAGMDIGTGFGLHGQGGGIAVLTYDGKPVMLLATLGPREYASGITRQTIWTQSVTTDTRKVKSRSAGELYFPDEPSIEDVAEA